MPADANAPQLRATIYDVARAPVTVQSARNRDGERIVVVHNWGAEPQVMTVPEVASDLVGDGALAAGDRLELGPWDVRVFAAGSVD